MPIGVYIIQFPTSDHVYGDFVPIYSDLSDACGRFYNRRSNRFLLAEIQLVLLTDIRPNAFKGLTEDLYIYFVDLLNGGSQFANSPRGNFVWLVNRVKGYVCIWIHQGRWVEPGQGTPTMALVEDLRPLTTLSQEQRSWEIKLRLPWGNVITYMDVLSDLVQHLILAQFQFTKSR